MPDRPSWGVLEPTRHPSAVLPVSRFRKKPPQIPIPNESAFLHATKCRCPKAIFVLSGARSFDSKCSLGLEVFE
jgi:hypothetical protein